VPQILSPITRAPQTFPFAVRLAAAFPGVRHHDPERSEASCSFPHKIASVHLFFCAWALGTRNSRTRFTQKNTFGRDFARLFLLWKSCVNPVGIVLPLRFVFSCRRRFFCAQSRSRFSDATYCTVPPETKRRLFGASTAFPQAWMLLARRVFVSLF
jgi:hypothetical protein